ncbi:MAG: hypothetical protein OEZ36_10730, partial [Spirochaetota bacterium]|nr:hypothetical protein [Spirochaetota bacterium]
MDRQVLMNHKEVSQFTPLLVLVFAGLILVFYGSVYAGLDKIGIPLTFSHHILEYQFFMKRGLGLCNPISRQGQILFKKEHIFYFVLIALNIMILFYYYRDIEYSERLYSIWAFFHCFLALFFFADYYLKRPA